MLVEIGKCDALFQAWTNRFSEFSDPFAALEFDEGRQAAIDKFLTDAWNWTSDIVAVNTKTSSEYIKILKLRGQKKIVCVHLGNEELTSKNENIIYLKNKTEIRQFFAETGMNYPRRILDLDKFLNSLQPKKQDINSEYETDFESLMQAWRIHNANVATMNKFGDRWIMQGIDNLPHIAENANISE